MDRSRWRPYAAVAALGALLYLPLLGLSELDDEEGRRAIPAREMLQNGAYVTPTIWGEPYLHKPPLYYWLVALAATAGGGVDELTARLPAALSTIATALALLWFGRLLAGPRAGLFAALLFLGCFGAFEKGAVGDMEAPLALATLFAVMFLWRGRTGDWRMLALSGLCLGAALMIKGPPALVFFCGAWLALAPLRRGDPTIRLGRPWLALALGAAPLAIWLLLVLAEADWRWKPMWITIRGQVVRGHGDDWLTYLADRRRLLVGVAVAWAPALLAIASAWRTRVGRALREPRLFRFLLATLGLSLVFFLAMKGTRTRYLYPAMPLACLAGGLALSRVAQLTHGQGERRLRWAAAPLCALGLVVAAAAVSLMFRPIGEIQAFSPFGYGLVAALATASLWLLVRKRRPELALSAAFVILAALRLIQVTQIAPRFAEKNRLRESAMRLERAMPADRALRTNLRVDHNALFYLNRRIQYIHRPLEARVGDCLLVRASYFREAMLTDANFEATALVEASLPKTRVALIRVLAAASRPPP